MLLICEVNEPISSTLGVSSIVCFRLESSQIPEELIVTLVDQSGERGVLDEPWHPLKNGERIRVGGGAYKGCEGAFEANGGKGRAILLLEISDYVTWFKMSECDLEAVV